MDTQENFFSVYTQITYTNENVNGRYINTALLTNRLTVNVFVIMFKFIHF